MDGLGRAWFSGRWRNGLDRQSLPARPPRLGPAWLHPLFTDRVGKHTRPAVAFMAARHFGGPCLHFLHVGRDGGPLVHASDSIYGGTATTDSLSFDRLDPIDRTVSRDGGAASTNEPVLLPASLFLAQGQRFISWYRHAG